MVKPYLVSKEYFNAPLSCCEALALMRQMDPSDLFGYVYFLDELFQKRNHPIYFDAGIAGIPLM